MVFSIISAGATGYPYGKKNLILNLLFMEKKSIPDEQFI